jgi:hypothetical protein
MVGASEEQQHAVLHEVLGLLQEMPGDRTPPEIGTQVHRVVRERLGHSDPYREIKEQSTAAALEIYPRLKRLVAESDDPLETAVRLSIGGNIIDFAITDHLADLWSTVERVLEKPLAIDHLDRLRRALSAADGVLYLADNAGETVFDRVLMEELPLPVTYGVRGKPILNDATPADAIAAGIADVAAIVGNGSSGLGTILELASDEFRRLYEDAPLIIAKGQVNYETLSEAGPRIFCLLQAKCQVIARDLGVPQGSLIVRQSEGA